MKLTVGERGLLVGLLPTEGSFDTLKVLHDLKMHLSFSDAEREEIKFENYELPSGKMATRWENNIEKDVPFTKSAVRIVEDLFLDLSRRNKLPAEAVPLYEKFIEDA